MGDVHDETEILENGAKLFFLLLVDVWAARREAMALRLGRGKTCAAASSSSPGG
jgi:hypothetical protein